MYRGPFPKRATPFRLNSKPWRSFTKNNSEPPFFERRHNPVAVISPPRPKGRDRGGLSHLSTCTSHLSDSDGGDFKLTWPRGALLARVAGRRGLPTVRGRLAEASQEKEGKGETARRSLQGRLAKGLEKKRKTGKSCGTDSGYTGRMATISSSWRRGAGPAYTGRMATISPPRRPLATFSKKAFSPCNGGRLPFIPV